MSKHRALVEGGPIPQDFLDAIQEFIGSQASPNLVVTILNPTTLRIPASADNGQVACAINGRWRYVSANVDAAAPGGLTVGDNPVFVAASDNSFATNPTPPPREIDSTDYTFRLLVLPVGSTPSGVGAQALWRQIGVATWTGTAFTDVRQTVGGGSLPKHAASHNPGGSDALAWGTVLNYGTLAGRPAPAASNLNAYYYATDTGALYQNQAGTWLPITATGFGSFGPTLIGNGVATSYAINHNLGTRDLHVTVRQAASPWAEIEADVEFTSTNTVTVSFAMPPATNSYSVFITSSVSATGAASQHASQHIAGGSDAISAILSARQVLEPGIAGQIRAGRVLVLTDFTTLLGLSAPQGLWNLGDLTDISGNGGNLTNKGAVTFGSGITGAVTEAAIFHGGATDSLYMHSGIYDLGGYGSWGCWFRTAKKATTQTLISKFKAAQRSWYMQIVVGNVIEVGVNLSGAAGGALTSVDGVTVVTDDRWHHAVCTYDGTMLSLYVDGVLEAQVAGAGSIYQTGTNADLNIGSDSADAGSNALSAMFGRIDEAFASTDVLSPEQVRMLYAAKVAHGLGSFPPIDATLSVRRRRKGGTLTIAPFSAQPLHLYDFTGGALTDAGSLNNALTNNNVAVAAPGAGGAQGNAFAFSAAATQYLSATDAGLPAGTAARSMGCWFKLLSNNMPLIDYGTGGNQYDLFVDGGGHVGVEDGANSAFSTQTFNDGQWHFAVAVSDNAAVDGLKHKLYVDGKLAATATAFNGTTLFGGGGFRVGRSWGATVAYLTGQVDGVFVTDYTMTADEVAKLYAVGSQQMPASPKNAGTHVEGFDATNLYVICDTLESQHLVDLVVSAA